MADKPKSKMQLLVEFMKANPEMTQAQVRKHFGMKDIKVSSAETSLAARKAGLRKPRKKGPAGKVLTVPVIESPNLTDQVDKLRKKNEQLRYIIEFLLDEEVDVLPALDSNSKSI